MKNSRALLFALVMGLLTACSADNKGGGQSGAAAPSGPPPAEVNVVVIAPTRAVTTSELPGRLQAIRSAQIRARVEGILEKRLYTEGSDVAAGAPLFRIDPRTYKAALEAAQADAMAAHATVERYRPLLKERAVSAQEFELAAAKYKQAQSVLSKAQLDYANAHITAPIAGRIGRAMVTEGALVGKGEATQLATIEQLDPIFVNFTRSSSEALRLRRALQDNTAANENSVQLLLEDGSVYPLAGKLLFTDMAIDPDTGAIQLRAQFPNPKRELLPGAFVRVRVPETISEGVFKVPQRAIAMNSQGASAMVVNEKSVVEMRPVKLGQMSGADWIITSGIVAGDKVIVDGLQKVRPGATAKIAEARSE